ncbi:hypothetical protein ACKS0A_02612 [Histoplasma ohiense]
MASDPLLGRLRPDISSYPFSPCRTKPSIYAFQISSLSRTSLSIPEPFPVSVSKSNIVSIHCNPSLTVLNCGSNCPDSLG